MSDQRWAESVDHQRLRFAAARAEFLDGGDTAALAVPDLVAASWRRSASAGVDATRYRVTYHSDIDIDSRLARCARPVLERLTRDMADVPVSIALTDSRARIIERRDCSNAVGRVLDRVDFNPGFSFEEAGVGTNGVGTVFETRQPVSVVGAAHFHESLVPFACAGAPVLDPLTGRIEGVLDVSLLSESWNPLIDALVRNAAGDIGRNLLLDRGHSQQALFEAYLRADARTAQAVLAVGDTVMLNRRAQHLLSPEEQAILRDHARYLMSRQEPSAEVLALPSGRRLRMRIARVHTGGDVTGVVLVFADAALPRVGPDLDPLDEHRHTTSRCAAWQQAVDRIDRALSEGGNLLLTGELGSGRATLAARRFHRLRPDGRQTTIDAAISAGPRIGPGILPGTAQLVLVRDIDTALPAAITRLAAVIRTLSTDPDTIVVATAATGRPIDPRLAELFEHGAAVPALRFRSADLPDLVGELVAELSPSRRTRVGESAMRVLTAHPWPGNIPQLRDALADALDLRPAGEITADDLPGYCRSTTPRRLTSIEVSERDTIVTALGNAAGNRVRAAAALGISRSSLYRKLKGYGITEV